MFEKGEYIHYGNDGVCMVNDIVKDLDGFPPGKIFYILTPAEHAGSVIYTPVDNRKVVMRKLLSREEAEKLIQEISQIPELSIEDDRAREHQYKDALLSGDCQQWIQVMKTAYMRKAERAAQGRKITTTDERYCKAAEEKLCEEFAFSLGKKKQEIQDCIRIKLNEIGK